MKNIIAYSAEKLYRDFEKADELFLLSGMKDMELYEKQLAEAARKAAAVKTSYASAARALGEDSVISKTDVMDKVHGIQTELPFPKPEKKKSVEHLYIEADEDYIHKQEKNGTEKKGSMIGKLLYLYEGQEKKDGRKELKNVFYLGGLCSGEKQTDICLNGCRNTSTRTTRAGI